MTLPAPLVFAAGEGDQAVLGQYLAIAGKAKTSAVARTACTSTGRRRGNRFLRRSRIFRPRLRQPRRHNLTDMGADRRR